ncbi:hypothetical protein CYMTET_24467, partial [Cymbomonas tetramitiformis]
STERRAPSTVHRAQSGVKEAALILSSACCHRRLGGSGQGRRKFGVVCSLLKQCTSAPEVSERSPPHRCFQVNLFKSRYADNHKLLRVLGMLLAVEPSNLPIRRLRAKVAMGTQEYDMVLRDEVLPHDEEGRALAEKAKLLRNEHYQQFSAQKSRPASPLAVQGASGRQMPMYSVGDVVRHTSENYRGVIVSWDLTCKRSLMVEAREPFPRDGGAQPFYVVYADDDRKKYVAEESLVLCPSIAAGRAVAIDHSGIGEYFQSFDLATGRYIPNGYTQYRFPDDMRWGSNMAGQGPVASLPSGNLQGELDSLNISR